ncbi:hypothetical protein M5689_007202 [Euphorbia peplus]|nr:hypothetical protein M5689_007202 [Euphorbia peplus]
MKSWKNYAPIALDYINQEEETEYILVDTYYAHPQETALNFTGYGHWGLHLFFEVELPLDKNTMIFIFAELSDPGIGKLSVTTYDITVSMNEWEPGCGMCPISNCILHPPHAYLVKMLWLFKQLIKSG